jgi:hypothetical protein
MAASLKDKRTPIATPPYQVPCVDVTPDPPIFSLVTTFKVSYRLSFEKSGVALFRAKSANPSNPLKCPRDVLYSEKADFSGMNGKRDLRLHTFAQINRFALDQVTNFQNYLEKFKNLLVASYSFFCLNVLARNS